MMMMSAEEVRQCVDGIQSADLERVGQCLCAVETVLSSFGPDGESLRPWPELLVCIPRLFALCISDDGDLRHDAHRTIRNICTVRQFARMAVWAVPRRGRRHGAAGGPTHPAGDGLAPGRAHQRAAAAVA
jgi:hypothetical protein